jgi:8-oxo-dGTP diphosphatase
MPEVVGAVLVKDNKAILTKRSSKCKSYPNKFEFPGGKVEKDEGLKQALVRELKEELNIDVEIKNIVDFEKNNLKINNLSLTLFIVNQWNGNIILDPDIHSTMIDIDFKYLNLVDDLIETDKLLVPDLIKSI